MPISLTPVNLPAPVELPVPGTQKGGSGDSFASFLKGSVQSVETLGAQANASVERMLAGEPQELHTTVIEVQKAEMAFDMFLQVRNKVVQAYQEVMRMQI